ALPGDVDVARELVAQDADPLNRLAQPRGAARHAAFVPHEPAELAMERVDAAAAPHGEQPLYAVAHLRLRAADVRVTGVERGELRLREIVPDRVGQDEVAVREPLH